MATVTHTVKAPIEMAVDSLERDESHLEKIRKLRRVNPTIGYKSVAEKLKISIGRANALLDIVKEEEIGRWMSRQAMVGRLTREMEGLAEELAQLRDGTKRDLELRHEIGLIAAKIMKLSKVVVRLGDR
jgi:hypothetical protein